MESKETPEAEAAVAIVRARGPRESVLLIRRSEREDDSWSGHWSFPGGRRDPGDPDLLHTALRELEEECGIRLDRKHTEAELPPVVARRKTGPFVLVAPFVFGVDRELATVLEPLEAAEAVWIPCSVLHDPARHSLRSVPSRPSEMRFPAIEVNGVPLWGFTYRLITDWLCLLPNPARSEPGFEMARGILDFLLHHGLRLKHGWEDRTVRQAIAASRLAKVAVVEGDIATALVLDEFAAPGSHIPQVNLLEVRPDYIHVAGLAFEEYFIFATAALAQ